MGVRKPFLLIPSIALALAPLWAIYMTVPMGWPLMVMVGIFDSARTIMVLALPLELMPKETVGTASGLIVSIGFSGGVVGPLVGGILSDIDWRLIFVVNLPVVVLALVVVRAAALEIRDETSEPRIDWPGLALLTFGLLALVFALVNADDWGWGSARTLGLSTRLPDLTAKHNHHGEL